MHRPGPGLLLTVLVAVLGAVAAALAPTRPLVPKGAAATSRTLVVGARRRRVLVVAPARRAGGRLPLVVVLHGSDAGPAWEERRTGLAALAAEGRAVLAYPAGVGRSWNAGQGCCGPAGRAGVDDAAFVLAVVDDAVAHLGVTSSRVYLVGYSNGGKLALRLAALDPERWAGVAVFGAVPLTPTGAGPAVPLLLAGGTADRRTPWAGPPSRQNGALAPSVTGAAERYRARDGLARATPLRRELAGGRVEVTTWRGPGPRHLLRLVAYRGWGHDWPREGVAPVALASLIEETFGLAGPG